VRLVVGVQPVREAIRAHGAKVERILVERGNAPQLAALARFARDQGIAVEELTARDLDRRAKGARHQGAIAIAPDLEIVGVEALRPGPTSLYVALDGVQDPQNFGAVIRSSVALGAEAVLFAEHAAAPLSPATFRASAGAVEHATLCRVPSLTSAIRTLADGGVLTVALDPNAADDLADLDLTGPVLFVIGSEGAGLRKSVRAACARRARLPMQGPVASLNASVAAALTLYEAARQRRFPSNRG
jgi:23S rRNA (guanosine2251-2'-O)-methyltransferase